MTASQLPDALLKLVSAGVDFPVTAFLPECEIVAGETLCTPEEVISHLSGPVAAILHTVIEDNSLTIVFERSDEMTLLTIRESWSFVFDGELVRKVIGCWGLLGQNPALATYREVDHYLRGFGFRF